MSERSLRSVYGGGWTPAKKALLGQVRMPTETRCWQCSKLKKANTDNFSEKKLQELRSAIAQGQAASNPTGKWIICRGCVGRQNEEMECQSCGEWKELKGFTKAQRRDPDLARCIVCVAGHLNYEPILEEPTLFDDGSDDGTSNFHEDSEFASESGGAPLSNSDQNDFTHDGLHVLNVSTTAGQSTNRSTFTCASIGETGRAVSGASADAINVWQNASRNAFVGYDAYGKAHPQVRAPSTTGSDSDESVATTASETHVTTAKQAPRSNFAKVKGTKGKPGMYVPQGKATRTVALKDYDDDSDELDDEDDYFTI